MADPTTTPTDVPNNFDNLPAGFDGGPTDGGFSGSHQHVEHLLQVGPTTEDQKNTFRPSLFPIACWRIDDVRFQFDSSVILLDAQPELQNLKALMAGNPKAPLSVFGHADPVGTDDYNKFLSGRRAQCVYGSLTRNTDLWEDIYSDNEGGDIWGNQTFQMMSSATGSSGLTNTKANRGIVFAAYMDLLCGPDFKVDAGAFLAQGADDKGKGDYQGCGEFNPIIMFSKAEAAAFQPQSMHDKRNRENGPNRRVMIFLFRPGSVVNPGKWPCPRVKEGVAGCKKRLWSDSDTRRSNQALRRNYSDTRDTFACRFYDRLSSGSPCEGGAIPPLPNLRIYLRLTWVDPDGTTPHPFPVDFPVIVRWLGGGELTTKVSNDGNIAFDFPRANQAFTLRFENPDNYIGTSADNATEKYLQGAEVDAAIKQGFRVWKLPLKWSLLQSDWPLVDDPHYNKTEARFEGLQSPFATVGANGSPVQVQLNPHWNFVRFEFFDRTFGHSNHSDKRIGLVPIVLEGFRVDPAVKGQAPNPDTRSNWAGSVDDDDKRSQALPWVVQRKLDKSLDVKPDAAILLQFVQPAGAFLNSVDAFTRTLEIVTDAARLAPGPERLKLYDLPLLWKSTKYFTRGAGNNKWFNQISNGEVLAANAAATPLAFSLDDIVLTDKNLNQQAVGGNQLALVFFHRFTQLAGAVNISPEGIWKRGADATKSFYPYTDINMPVAYYVHDYPDWTRLVIVNGNAYEAFAERVTDAGSNEVSGARAAVNWIDEVAAGRTPTNPVPLRPGVTRGQKNFYAVQPFFCEDIHPVRGSSLPKGTYREWQSPVAASPGAVYGRFDINLLRCCDVDTGDEVSINMHFFRFHFDFTTPPAKNKNGTPFIAANYKQAAVANIPKRWNGPETIGNGFPVNPGDFVMKPQTAGPKIQSRPYFFAQDVPQPRAHFLLNIKEWTNVVLQSDRAFMDGVTGVGDYHAGNEAPDAGAFVAAHETGHGDSLPDEYNERWSAFSCSYEFPGFGCNVPGDPYDTYPKVTFALMLALFTVQARYFWHAAEWLHGVLNIPLQIESGTFKYFLPPHPSAPKRTFTFFPLFIESRGSAGTRGQFDLYLYPLGEDEYRQSIKTGVIYQGILMVVVKIRVEFAAANAHNDIVGPLQSLLADIDSNLNGRFVFNGSLGPATFVNSAVKFTPRLLVEKLVSDNTPANIQYLAGLGYNPPGAATQNDYTNKVNAVDARHPKHFTLRVVTSGATGWHSSTELRLTAAQLNAPGVWMWFADMVGIDCSNLPNPLAGMTNAKVQSTIVQRAVAGATVSTSA